MNIAAKPTGPVQHWQAPALTDGSYEPGLHIAGGWHNIDPETGLLTLPAAGDFRSLAALGFVQTTTQTPTDD